jgi:type II secretory pathway pseudopilin PulG|tara:strand:- start:2547 stop:2969 length:423 start_codon:yes stop_codon:yes gene_type:complete
MSVYSQVEKAEEAIRQSLINALAEGEDQYLTDLFNLLTSIRDVKKGINTIRFTDNTREYYNRQSEWNFNLSSDYLDSSHGGDLDSLDNILDFSSITNAATTVPIPGAYGEDVISFNDYPPSGEITFNTDEKDDEDTISLG